MAGVGRSRQREALHLHADHGHSPSGHHPCPWSLSEEGALSPGACSEPSLQKGATGGTPPPASQEATRPAPSLSERVGPSCLCLCFTVWGEIWGAVQKDTEHGGLCVMPPCPWDWRHHQDGFLPVVPAPPGTQPPTSKAPKLVCLVTSPSQTEHRLSAYPSLLAGKRCHRLI